MIAASAPHLSAAERDELRAAYLGNLTWETACAAVDLPFASLPDATEDRPPSPDFAS
jgi:hypothetical protein